MSYLHDASPTWNGFNYQGKVALCAVLDTLINIPQDQVSEYSLELEWLEDFAIKRNQEYQTLHQVKNYDSNNLGDFKFAIESLLMKGLKVVTINEIKSLITARNVNKDNLATTIVTDLKASGIITDNDTISPGADFNILGLTGGVIRYEEAVRTKLLMLNEVFNNSANLTGCFLHIAEPLDTAFTTINLRALDNLGDYLGLDGCDDVLDSIQLYSYNPDSHCGNVQITQLLDNRIRDYLVGVRGLAADSPECNADNLIQIRRHLLGLIDNNISERHQAIRENRQREIANIPLDLFENILGTAVPLANNLYHSYVLRERFDAVLREELVENDQDTNVCNALQYISDKIMLDYPSVQFIDFCFKISPQTINFSDVQSSLEVAGLRNSFLNFFKMFLHENLDIFIKDQTNDYSLVTTILETNYLQREKRLYFTIKENIEKYTPYQFNIKKFIGDIGVGNGNKKSSELIDKVTTATTAFLPPEEDDNITKAFDFTVVHITDEIARLNA